MFVRIGGEKPGQDLLANVVFRGVIGGNRVPHVALSCPQPLCFVQVLFLLVSEDHGLRREQWNVRFDLIPFICV